MSPDCLCDVLAQNTQHNTQQQQLRKTMF